MSENKTLAISETFENDGYLEACITLRTWGKDEWVTHCYTPENKAYFWGHYSRSFDDAYTDYKKRCDKYGVCYVAPVDERG